MSHEDAVIKLPKKFKSTAFTKDSKLTIIENSSKKIFGVQFHPEVTHTENGIQLFKNFLFLICKSKKKMGCCFSKTKTHSRSEKIVKKKSNLCSFWRSR